MALNTRGDGAWPTLQAATATVVPGGYYGPTGLGETRGPSGQAVAHTAGWGSRAGAALWDVSVAMTGIDPGLPP
jgi:hypothetical protein